MPNRTGTRASARRSEPPRPDRHLARFGRGRLAVEDIALRRPTLDEVFLTLTDGKVSA